MLLVIDNYDSFTYNLVQYFGELGADPVVKRHDAISPEEVDKLKPQRVVISPGPGRPQKPEFPWRWFAGWAQQRRFWAYVWATSASPRCTGEG